MAIQQEIEIEIDPSGNVKMKTHGIKGAACETEVSDLEKAVGPVRARSRTSEYYEKAVHAVKKLIGNHE